MLISDAAHQLHVDVIAHVQLTEELASVLADCASAEARPFADFDFLEEGDLSFILILFTDLIDQDEFLLQTTQLPLIFIHKRLKCRVMRPLTFQNSFDVHL